MYRKIPLNYLFIFVSGIVAFSSCGGDDIKSSSGLAKPVNKSGKIWVAPDTVNIPKGKAGDMIRYGRDLLAHTGIYFGPKGSIARISNGMNCQNCHLDGGTKTFANNYASFISGYPKMSFRSGKIEPASQRIVDCFERSLNGKAPDTTGKEVQAILTYMKWLGRGVKKGEHLFGASTEKLPYMNYAADVIKGKMVYVAKCLKCHGADGSGIKAQDSTTYTYPPLWGKNSYNDGAGMYRIGNLAGFIKNNMPYGVSYKDPQLTNQEAWNVAAYINSQPKQHYKQIKDWPDITKKPVDFPFGPYADTFTEQQHKYGPFNSIKLQQQAKR